MSMVITSKNSGIQSSEQTEDPWNIKRNSEKKPMTQILLNEVVRWNFLNLGL